MITEFNRMEHPKGKQSVEAPGLQNNPSSTPCSCSQDCSSSPLRVLRNGWKLRTPALFAVWAVGVCCSAPAGREPASPTVWPRGLLRFVTAGEAGSAAGRRTGWPGSAPGTASDTREIWVRGGERRGCECSCPSGFRSCWLFSEDGLYDVKS